MPDRQSTLTLTLSRLCAVRGEFNEALHSQRRIHELNGANPASGKRKGMEQATCLHKFRLRTVTRITRPNIRCDLASLSPHQGCAFVAPNIPAERIFMIISDNALAEIAHTWDAQAIRLPLTASIEQATTNEEGAAFFWRPMGPPAFPFDRLSRPRMHP